MDRMVEIARFQYPADAQVLIALLKSEGIECYLRNELSTQILSHIDVGGARVEILESDVPRAMELMKEGGFDLPEENESPEGMISATNWMNRVPVLKKYSLPVQMIFLSIIVILALALFLGLGLLLQQANPI
ncbi:MAG: DUF2007 domain-containing protein [Tannerellaceae bacterium]|nr:DUF2007 domain-containing protein [Tannerellaceae bacterium]